MSHGSSWRSTSCSSRRGPARGPVCRQYSACGRLLGQYSSVFSYALFVSIMNLSGVVGEMLEGAVVRELDDMGLFLIVAAVVSWLPLLVI